ncbi:transglutaminase family protein [Chelatococcus sambhunathii]|uniref:Transglutaminase family protein n=1 Tax=Chelatococcus sambhunathii TaxID=363953 RepID=A0ABU1DHW7_9HYPH|nr:transglutaminase family protein [Chelatococcus sambhunathii]MDR4307687.1 transglutaminase family protein [Chelatococcus sambhunathii]
MDALRIRHRTAYRYRRPVSLQPHRLVMRPRESRELRLVAFDIRITPAASLAWSYDVSGNAVATATFRDPTNALMIESVADIELDAPAWPVFDIAASAILYPFAYSDDERADLGSSTLNQHLDPQGRLRDWARGFVYSWPTDTLSLLKDVNAGVWSGVAYEIREDEGTQSPLETLDRKRGSCRDFATLFAETVRSLGFGARVVSGYLHDPGLGLEGSAGPGSTHAWAEVYVPGAGWITFDPTNQSVGGANLIPVAVARDVKQIMPVSGSYVGSVDAFSAMTVEVSVGSVPSG